MSARASFSFLFYFIFILITFGAATLSRSYYRNLSNPKALPNPYKSLIFRPPGSQVKLKTPFHIGLGFFLWLNPKRINLVFILLIPFTGLSSLAVPKV
jgi:hypothetical protein